MQIFLARACILLNFDTFFPISVAILLSSSLSLALFLLLPYSLPPFPLLSSSFSLALFQIRGYISFFPC